MRLAGACTSPKQKIDITLLKSANHQVAENREILKVIIDALLFTARQNIALRGHDESNTSMNKGNFLELSYYQNIVGL